MHSVAEIFWRFLVLGCTSFGGPAAHLGYFRTVFVDKLHWLDDVGYARLIALSQFLPGPGSSQVGFGIGCHRAGVFGGMAAFIGFTLPSFVLMYALAVVSGSVAGSDIFQGTVHGLKLLAVVVVATATLGMFRSFCKSALPIVLFAATVSGQIILPGMTAQFTALGIAALIGAWQIRPNTTAISSDGRIALLPLVAFSFLLIGLPVLAIHSDTLKTFNQFYQTGSLVFGGGHVVLPLLQGELGNAVTPDRFLLGYAGAQGIPGPMFTLATYLGAELTPGNSLAGATIATIGIFLPGFLLLLGLRGAWEQFATQPKIAGAAAGINAAVVGLLAAALYQPVFVSAVSDWIDFGIAIGGFALIHWKRPPILVLVLSFAAIGAGLSMLNF